MLYDILLITIDESCNGVVVFPSLQRRIQQMKEPEYPIFKRQDADLPGQASGITHLSVSSGWVTLVMVGNLIYRYNIANPGNVERKLHLLTANILYIVGIIRFWIMDNVRVHTM